MMTLSTLFASAHVWLQGKFAADVAPEPSPTPTLREELEPMDVSPGFEGFVVTFLLVAVVIVLFLSMTRRMRRIRYRGQKEEQAAVEAVGRTSSAGAEPVSTDAEGRHHDGDKVAGPPGHRE